jgi:hypothetical protein
MSVSEPKILLNEQIPVQIDLFVPKELNNNPGHVQFFFFSIDHNFEEKNYQGQKLSKCFYFCA